MARSVAPATSLSTSVRVGHTAHLDTFCRDHLPPPELWPDMDWSFYPQLATRHQLNCAAELLDDCVKSGDGERTVFRCGRGDWTYRRLLESSNRLANVLQHDLGLLPGNRVLLRGPNSPMLAACWFAVLKLGGVAVCTMPMLRARELRQIINKAEVNLCLTEASLAAECDDAIEDLHRCRVVSFSPDGSGELESMAARKSDAFATYQTLATDVAIIAFTSGTTGEAKGTMHFHRDLMVVADCFPACALKPDPDDVFTGSPSVAFTYGLGGLLLFPMRYHASAVLLDRSSPSSLLEGIQKFRASICFTSPTAYRAMLRELGQYNIASLRKCVSAAETLPATTFEAWRQKTGLNIIDGIGSTELLHIFISAPEDQIRPGSTGKVLKGYEACVLDENGQEVPPGVIGRLAVRGPTGCRYLDDIENQRRYVRNGWNITGDAFRRDENGYFWYQSRLDDLIISSGYNISGAEIENVLLDHPKVNECAVVGVLDTARGSVVKAFVVLQDGVVPNDSVVKELQEFVKSQIAPYKYPRAIKFMKALPRTPTGKLQRFKLREES
ncbi:MAG TPA: AMP-binding protein [Terriglobales bacterium]|nr:AMP-binding protein [Terriglobales bacterium]